MSRRALVLGCAVVAFARRDSPTESPTQLDPTVLSSAELLSVTLNPGDIIVLDQDAFGGPGGIIKVDPITGTQDIISSGSVLISRAAVFSENQP